MRVRKEICPKYAPANALHSLRLTIATSPCPSGPSNKPDYFTDTPHIATGCSQSPP